MSGKERIFADVQNISQNFDIFGVHCWKNILQQCTTFKSFEDAKPSFHVILFRMGNKNKLTHGSLIIENIRLMEHKGTIFIGRKQIVHEEINNILS